ncbi:hypothetical protein Z051_09575 [Rhodococcus rhodochrous KG-21]|uniref:Uncharacterized protein n=1 Tax=Rhodococcus rhodochrous KG-21 TaxID=1441923 RepID=A0A0M8PQF3_RHORH|nr:hypothetical protein Z051_09575 [Rhodococcus rhodochrous KG-21]
MSRGLNGGIIRGLSVTLVRGMNRTLAEGVGGGIDRGLIEQPADRVTPPALQLRLVPVESDQLVHDDTAQHVRRHRRMRLGHGHTHVPLLHQPVVADERADEDLFGVLVDDDVETLHQLGDGGPEVVRVPVACEREQPAWSPISDTAVAQAR